MVSEGQTRRPDWLVEQLLQAGVQQERNRQTLLEAKLGSRGAPGSIPSPAIHLTGVRLGTCFWSLTRSFISKSQKSGTVGSDSLHPTLIFEQSIPPLSKLCRNLARWGP